MSNPPYGGLETISEDGKPPASRLNDPKAVHDIVQRLIHSNDKRSRTDATVFGFFSGNPPYKQSELNKLGQGFRSNFPSRIGESFLNNALGIYWDMVSEGPTYCAVRTAFGKSQDEKEEYSGIITEEFQKLNKDDPDLNYMFRLSQFEMVLYRCGPVMWSDEIGYKAKAINQRYVLVPDRTKSNVCDWPLSVVRCTYTADELYGFIQNSESASRRGWKISAVRKALMDAANHDIWPTGRNHDWEWYEQTVRNNDIYMGLCGSEQIAVAHMLYREFPKNGKHYGKISHCMVLENQTSEKGQEFLFRKVGRFDNWLEVVNPFYYDIGDGTHHSVKGLGIKAHGMLAAYDRLQNHMTDAAFVGSSLNFQAKTANDLENLSVVTFGPYVWHPPGGEYLQTMQLGTALDGPMAIKQDMLATVTNNLAQYRQQVNRVKGNPPTATQIQYEAQNLSEIGKSPLTWYFEQCDTFWEERYRRAANATYSESMPGGKECKEFQERCYKRGVPKEALKKTESVRTTRTIGFGSAASRLMTMDRLMSRFPLYDEAGKHKLLEDVTAADVGYSLMRRYVPSFETRGVPTEQHGEAQQSVALLKLGIDPLIYPRQDAVIYAQTYIQAAAEAAASLQQGANPLEVFNFLNVAGPAIQKQLARIAQDPTRKQIFDALTEQWKKLAQITDKIGQQLQRQMQQNGQQQQKQAQVMNDQQLKQMTAQADMQRKNVKAGVDIDLKRRKSEQAMASNAAKTRQGMALSDAKTANDIVLQQEKAKAAEKSASE